MYVGGKYDMFILLWWISDVLASYGYMVTLYGNVARKGIIFVLIIMSDGGSKES